MFKLPDLPYSYDALEPHIDAKTMEIHHKKHHQAYIDKLNASLEKHSELTDKSIIELISNLNTIPEDIRESVRNNGGGHLNHWVFWEIMSPDGGGEPSGKLAGKINEDFGSFSELKKQFGEKGVSRFGSGWVWLVFDKGKLSVVSTPNQDNPLSDGLHPVIGVDVWEHAYYLKYQNRRPEYLEAWWNVVNWEAASKHFDTL
jgi:superoxide dismutase, Fe-Mn family